MGKGYMNRDISPQWIIMDLIMADNVFNDKEECLKIEGETKVQIILRNE